METSVLINISWRDVPPTVTQENSELIESKLESTKKELNINNCSKHEFIK